MRDLIELVSDHFLSFYLKLACFGPLLAFCAQTNKNH